MGCKSVSGKMYKEKCQGFGILQSRQGDEDGSPMAPEPEPTVATPGGGEIKRLKDDSTVKYCMCEGKNCNHDNVSINGGNSLKGLEVTGNGLVLIMIMTTRS